jgi:hypothetical protein
LQPNFQYILHPGAGATNPVSNNLGRVLKNAEVFGLREQCSNSKRMTNWFSAAPLGSPQPFDHKCAGALSSSKVGTFRRAINLHA